MSLPPKFAELSLALRKRSRRGLTAALGLVAALALLGGFAAIGNSSQPVLSAPSLPVETAAVDGVGDPYSFRTGPRISSAPERHLILLPGGGFTRYDTTFEGTMVFEAEMAGFVPHYVPYRLGNLGAAVRDARGMASWLGEKYGTENVFAYGSSAGGTLATLLAGEGRVSAAVASSALYDFQFWPWANIYWGPEYFDEIRASDDLRRVLSPLRRPLRCPVLSMHGEADPIVSVFQAEDFAFSHQRATLRLFRGGHGIYKRLPWTVPVGMQWLHKTAKIQDREAERRLARMAELPRRIKQMTSRSHRRYRVRHSGQLCAQRTAVSVSRMANLSSRP